VGSLVLARPAQGEVVYTPTNITIKTFHGRPKDVFSLDLNNDGVIDFTLTLQVGVIPCVLGGFGALSFVDEIPANRNGVEGVLPSALKRGDSIGSSQTFYAGSRQLRRYDGCNGGHVSGEFGAAKAYLGLMLQSMGKTYYGWARLSVIADATEASVTLTGYAYETTPGEPINAGQTTGTMNEMNEDSSGGAYLITPIPDTVQPVFVRTLTLADPGVLWRRIEPGWRTIRK
jgi:hypothetical protein